MIKNLWSGKLKYVLFGIVCCIIIIVVLFSLPILAIPVTAIETYTETEIREEPYTTAEVYSIEKPYQELILDKRITIYPFKTPNDIFKYSFSYKAYDNTVFGGEYGKITAGANAGNCKLVVNWESTDKRNYSLGVGFLDCEYLEKVSLVGEILAGTVIENVKSPGKIEYLLIEDCNPIQLLIYNFDTAVNLHIYGIYSWSISEKEIRQITKYLEVPVQVEKQRTVTKYEKGSMWRLLFAK